ncbi:MAG: hypothetical protein JSS28_07080 [Proteobacteria bacterium]|nr:hypothetical protein [Pseudomonadota bacterium]
MKPRLDQLLPALRRGAFAAVLAGIACAQAFAQSTGASATIANDAAPPRGIAPGWTLTVSGQWPTQCPPTLQAVALEGSDLRIDARSVLDLCAREATPFSIELDPALALQRAALAPGVYHVSFFAADGAQAAAKLRAFALVDRSPASAERIVPENGFWWSDGTDRTLLSLELQGTQLSAALLGYDSAGQPEWLFGTAPFDGRIAHIALLRLSGGSDPFAPADAAPRGDAALTLDLQFATSARASAWLSRTRGDDGALQLRSLDLARLPLAEATDGRAWQGDWVLVQDTANRVAQRLRLDRFQAVDARHFQLASDDGAVVLACERAAAAQDALPRSCTLRLADGTASQLDSVAIGRMDGHAASGASVHLLRITP